MNAVVIAWLGVTSAVLAAGVSSGHVVRFETQGPVMPAAGQISGTVIAASTGSPIRGATVSLSDDDDRDYVVESDGEGRFQFDRLPAGRYQLTATQPGFLDVTYGQKRPGSGGLGVAIRLADGQRLERVVLAMPRGGAISGVVLDPYGDPAFGASVTVLRYAWTRDQRLLVPGDSAVTDERGMYRIPVLPPGDYIVKATPPGSTNGEGANPAPVYHPGTASASAATAVTLGVSEERSGIDVSLQRITTHRVTGMVVDANGRPPARPLMIAIADADAPAGGIDTGTQVLDGKFTFAGLAPGRYSITVLVGSGVQAMTTNMAEGIDDSRDDGPALWAQADVTVLDRDVRDVRLQLQAGSSVSGRVVSEDGASLPNLSSVRVRIVPATSRAMWRSMAGVAVNARGGFTIAGIPPGRYRFSTEGIGPAVALRSAVAGGRDALDFPVEVAPPAALDGVVLTVTDRTTGLSGTLSDVTGQPTSDYLVVVFAADARYWDVPSRRIVAMRPGADGRYTFRGLPAGDYQLAAFTDAEPGQWFDPRFLRELVSASIAVRLGEGEQRTQDVRVK